MAYRHADEEVKASKLNKFHQEAVKAASKDKDNIKPVMVKKSTAKFALGDQAESLTNFPRRNQFSKVVSPVEEEVLQGIKAHTEYHELPKPDATRGFSFMQIPNANEVAISLKNVDIKSNQSNSKIKKSDLSVAAQSVGTANF